FDPLPVTRGSRPLRSPAQQVAADAGLGQSVWVVDKVVPVAALDAQFHPVYRGLRVGRHTDDAVVLHMQVKVAADPAVRTGAGDAPVAPAEADRHFVLERSGRAVGHARPARLTAGVEHSGVQAGDDLSVVTPVADAPDEAALHLLAGPHTART